MGGESFHLFSKDFIIPKGSTVGLIVKNSANVNVWRFGVLITLFSYLWASIKWEKKINQIGPQELMIKSGKPGLDNGGEIWATNETLTSSFSELKKGKTKDVDSPVLPTYLQAEKLKFSLFSHRIQDKGRE